MPKEVYRLDRYSVKLYGPEHDGTVYLQLHVDGETSPSGEWQAHVEPPPRPRYALLLEIVSFVLGDPPFMWNAMSVDEAINLAIAAVERLRARDLKCLDYQRRIDVKLQDLAFRQNAAAEVEAEIAPPQISYTSRESE